MASEAVFKYSVYSLFGKLINFESDKIFKLLVISLSFLTLLVMMAMVKSSL